MKYVYALGVCPDNRPRSTGKDVLQRAENFHTVQRDSLWIDLHGRMRGHQRQPGEHVHIRSLASCWLSHGYNKITIYTRKPSVMRASILLCLMVSQIAVGDLLILLV